MCKSEFRPKKAQSGIPKNYVIIKIEPIRARFRQTTNSNIDFHESKLDIMLKVVHTFYKLFNSHVFLIINLEKYLH